MTHKCVKQKDGRTDILITNAALAPPKSGLWPMQVDPFMGRVSHIPCWQKHWKLPMSVNSQSTPVTTQIT